MGALTAEFSKMLRHRALWGLVWIFPIGLTLLFVLGMLLRNAHPVHPPSMRMSADIWIDGTTVVWKVAGIALGRYFVGAFTALVFAGEYGWNTWKLIVPHRRRLDLIAAKYAVVVGLLMLSFAIASVLAIALNIISPMVTGATPPPDGITVGALLAAHGRSALAALVSTLLTVGYASLASILLRSTLGGAVVAVAVVTAEGLASAFAPLLDPTLFLALPSYHLRNLTSWIVSGRAAVQLLPSGMIQDPWTTSLAWIAAWTVVLWVAAIVTFERQDLN
jgi:ABC-type transport system involved in multi-copper enzyme maturation permease subunit